MPFQIIRKIKEKLAQRAKGATDTVEPATRTRARNPSPEAEQAPRRRTGAVAEGDRRRPANNRRRGKRSEAVIPSNPPSRLRESEEWSPGQSKKARPEEEAARSDRPPTRRARRGVRTPAVEGTAVAAPADTRAEAAWTLDQFQVEPAEGKTRFHDIGLPDQIMHAIADLGFQYCTPIQSKVLTHTKSGDNVAGRAQTGTGKTAAFLITVFSSFLGRGGKEARKTGRPRALVLAPTRELVIQIIKDAEELAKYCPFRCLAVYGGMDLDRQQRALENSPVDLIAATPGRLIDFCRRKVVDLSQVEVLVIDEADRMLDMGFIPDVRRIIRMTPPKQQRCSMLFSATLTEDVLRLASQWMPDPVICEVEAEQVTVDAVDQIVYAVPASDKFALLYNLIAKRGMKRVLVFGNRRDATRRVTERLRRTGISCALLSGEVQQKKRLSILEDFKSGRIQALVATDVAGRGLHIDDIDHVINYDFPYEPEDYVHRIGRTGRAGAEGTAISFACEEESFIIPDIEAYIGRPLKCVVPEEELIAAPPRGKVHPNSEESAPVRKTNRSRGRSGRRSGGQRGRGRRPR